MFDDGRLKQASYDSTEGFGLRVVSGETAGYAHSSEISEAAIARAGEAAALAKRGATGGRRRRGPAPDQRQALWGGRSPRPPGVRRQGGAAPGDRRLRPRPRSAHRPGHRLHLRRAAPDRDPARRRPAAAGRAAAGAGQCLDHRRARRPPRDRLVRRRRTHHLRGLGLARPIAQGQVDEALRSALVNLDAIACPAGEMDVVIGPGWNGVLLHEAVGHGLEGDFNRKGISAFSGRIGDRVGAPGVTVFDDGSIADRRGSLTIDDEGTPTSRTILIEDGILRGYMHDRQSARLMGMAATGNARRQSYAHMPMPRMTNTAMLRRRHPPRGDDRLGLQARCLLRQFRRRSGRHHQRQIRLPVHRGLHDRGRQGDQPGQGRHPDRRRAVGPDPGGR